MPYDGHLGLAYAELAFYALFAPIIAINTWRHRNLAIIPWIFLLAFATLQLIGAGLVVTDLRNHTQSASARIVSQVGLSPLLLTVMGLMAEV